MDIIRKTSQHRYQLLTKRAERMAEFFSVREIPANVWLDITVEANVVKHRIDDLRHLPASVRFLSYEPLIESLGKLNLEKHRLGYHRR